MEVKNNGFSIPSFHSFSLLSFVQTLKGQPCVHCFLIDPGPILNLLLYILLSTTRDANAQQEDPFLKIEQEKKNRVKKQKQNEMRNISANIKATEKKKGK